MQVLRNWEITKTQKNPIDSTLGFHIPLDKSIHKQELYKEFKEFRKKIETLEFFPTKLI